jgi:hypothetical protein
MAFNNIYDLYNTVLEDDKPLVDTCMAEIKTQIETITAANDPFTFDYDLDVKLSNTVELVQKKRIRDQIIFQLRTIGIRCTGDYLKLTIFWFIRDDREFMKSYY